MITGNVLVGQLVGVYIGFFDVIVVVFIRILMAVG